VNIWPLKFRNIKNDKLIFADDSGAWFLGDESFLERYVHEEMTEGDQVFLANAGHTYASEDTLSYTSFAYRWSQRQFVAQDLNYLIVVPTLRCNLTCTYCQVSRAPEHAVGFDWSPEHIAAFFNFLRSLPTRSIKVEFQGGEPLLRLDLLEQVRTFCRDHFATCQFVVCTNLQSLTPEHWAFLNCPDTFVSTSLDGNAVRHSQNRTQSLDLTSQFQSNLESAANRLQAGHVSALPTIDPRNPPTYAELIDVFGQFGMRSIYLRPINHQGFARRQPPSSDESSRWFAYHAGFIDYLIELNWSQKEVFEEYYFSHCLRRALQTGVNSHVDIRNPNVVGRDYLVIDFDGKFYPTDEARMLSRIGHIDLSIGSLTVGADLERVTKLNHSSFNNFDPDCIHCPYQAFCGTDTIDDVSRYGRIDLPRHETWFCQRQLSIFDKLFELIYSNDPKVCYSLAKWAGLQGWPEELSPVLR
jgi:His-Xaa-Ser system radical SAM maturase HxsB